MSYLAKAQAMQAMMGENKMMEAFEKYYADNVTVIEMPNNEVREGKAAQRAAIENWQGMVKEMHGGGVDSICANEEAATTTVESWVDLTFKDGNRMKMQEVAVQRWEGDQIVKEQFYYNMPGQ